MAEMGFKMFRMSISWSRLFPTGVEKQANPEGVEFYRNVFTELRAHGIEPLVTLWHFDTPLYLEETLGDWKNRELIEHFDRFAETCFREFRGLVRYWLTFNEINNTINFLPDDIDDSYYQDACLHLHNKFVASARAVIKGHEIDPENKIGCMICGITYYPHTDDPQDILFCRHKWEKGLFYCGDVQCFGEYPVFAQRIWNEHHVRLEISEEDKALLKQGCVDFYSFSYYMSQSVTVHQGEETVAGNMSIGVRNSHLTYSDWGWACDPDGLQYYLELAYDRYKRDRKSTRLNSSH